MKRRPHQAFRATGVQWLQSVPANWEVTRLKFVATYTVSSVDKVPSDDEIPVRLCNYTDVYYGEFIRPDMPFMETTATPEEIRKFRLRKGDVVITKDSEDWRDIAVPALVIDSADDLVCGYHLAIIRATPTRLSGRYLLRVLQSRAVNQQFQIAAAGVTRYGLPKSAIGNAVIPLPPLGEQEAIADFLDARTTMIDTLAGKKRGLSEAPEENGSALIGRTVHRLQEYRAALINAVVTGIIDVQGDVPDAHDEFLELRLIEART